MESSQEFGRIAGELLRAVRGRRPQGKLSERLGYRGNPLYRWESGSRSIRWNAFARLARACRIDLREILRVEFGYLGEPECAADFLRHLMASSEIGAFCEVTGVSRSILSKWLHGRSQPTLNSVLQVLDRHLRVLPQFIARLTGPEALPSMRDRAERARTARGLLADHPETAAILATLDLAEYRELDRHRPGWIAGRLGFPVEHEERMLARMVHAGLIRAVGEAYAIATENIDTRGEWENTRKMRLHWMQVAAEKLSAMPEPRTAERFAHCVFAVSDEADALIRKAFYDYFSAVRTIVENDHGARTFVRGINVQDVRLSAEK